MKAAASSIGPAAQDVRSALASGIARLEAASVPSAALAAELLLLHVLRRDQTGLGCDRAWLYAHSDHALDAEQSARFARLLEQRAAGAPVQYLTGRQEFWGLEFEVNPSVLIPRPETEHIVEAGLARFGAKRAEPLRIADVGTGSGCLAVALAHELPLAQVVATDISSEALEVARRNAARHGVSQRIEFRQMNLLSSYLTASAGPPFDLIVSNPPYIGRAEAAELPREVREHEPHEALFAGPQGVEAYPPLIAQAETLLGEAGWLIVELGHNGAPHIRPLLKNPQWSHVAVERDLAGLERVLCAQRTAERPRFQPDS